VTTSVWRPRFSFVTRKGERHGPERPSNVQETRGERLFHVIAAVREVVVPGGVPVSVSRGAVRASRRACGVVVSVRARRRFVRPSRISIRERVRLTKRKGTVVWSCEAVPLATRRPSTRTTSGRVELVRTSTPRPRRVGVTCRLVLDDLGPTAYAAATEAKKTSTTSRGVRMGRLAMRQTSIRL
jgi:hypothetical protein